MEGDRGAALTVRAAVRGIIDFGKADILSRRWWRRCNVLLGAMEREDQFRVLDADYRYHLALLGNPALTDESFKRHQDLAAEAYNDIVNAAYPWAARTQAERQRSEYLGLREEYIRKIGNLDDPEFMKTIHAEVERMLRPEVPEGPATMEEIAAEREAAERAAKAKAIQRTVW